MDFAVGLILEFSSGPNIYKPCHKDFQKKGLIFRNQDIRACMHLWASKSNHGIKFQNVTLAIIQAPSGCATTHPHEALLSGAAKASSAI